MGRAAVAKRWRAEHPAEVAAYNEERRRAYRAAHPLARLTCSECGVEFEGRPDRVTCGRRCKDARYARLHPQEAAAKVRRHDRRVRERRRAAAGRGCCFSVAELAASWPVEVAKVRRILAVYEALGLVERRGRRWWLATGPAAAEPALFGLPASAGFVAARSAGPTVSGASR